MTFLPRDSDDIELQFILMDLYEYVLAYGATDLLNELEAAHPETYAELMKAINNRKADIKLGALLDASIR